MARSEKQPEAPAQSVGPWIVTFSDCMTLLLCFFVLLLTFSSFDEAAKAKLAGAFNYRSFESIFPLEHRPKESVTPSLERPVDRTQHGSEMPTDVETEMTKNPRKNHNPFGDDAYRDRQTFRVPSDRLFVGRSTVPNESGRQYLDKVAAFVQHMPCRVVISETSEDPPSGPADLGLQRSWAILHYFVHQKGLPASRFSVQVCPSGQQGVGHRDTVNIMLLKQEAL